MGLIGSEDAAEFNNTTLQKNASNSKLLFFPFFLQILLSYITVHQFQSLFGKEHLAY